MAYIGWTFFFLFKQMTAFSCGSNLNDWNKQGPSLKNVIYVMSKNEFSFGYYIQWQDPHPRLHYVKYLTSSIASSTIKLWK